MPVPSNMAGVNSETYPGGVAPANECNVAIDALPPALLDENSERDTTTADSLKPATSIVGSGNLVHHPYRRAHVPNTTLSIIEMLRALVRPIGVPRAEQRIRETLPDAGIPVAFASARGALCAAFEVLAPRGRVAIPAFTCAAVANAARVAGTVPVFVDVGSDGLIRLGDLPDADVVLVQNTFGLPARLPPRRTVVQDAAHRVDLVESSAAEVVVTSFEQSKWLSTGQGGIAFARDERVATALRACRDRHPAPKGHSQHVAITLLISMLGRLEFTRVSRTSKRLRRLLARIALARLQGQTAAELQGAGLDPVLLGPPNRGVARLLLTQLGKRDAVAAHRRRIVEIYDRACGVARASEPLVRYPMAVADPHRFEIEFRHRGWDVSGRWFSSPLHPAGTDLASMGYEVGTAPSGELLASSVINLPTHLLVTDGEASQLIATALEFGAHPLPFDRRPDE